MSKTREELDVGFVKFQSNLAADIEAVKGEDKMDSGWASVMFLKAELDANIEDNKRLSQWKWDAEIELDEVKRELAAAKECVAIANRSADDQMHQKREAQIELARLREQYQEILDVNSTGAERLKFVLTENTRLRAELKVANHSIVSSFLYNTLKEKNASLRDENERLKDGGVQRIKDALAATLDARDAAIARAEKAEAEVEQTKDYAFWKDTAKTRAENLEQASEQMLVYEQTIARLRAEVAELQDRLETSMDHHLKYRDNLREDLSAAHSENEQLKEEINQARRAWLGDDYGHLPLIEAMEKFRNDREAEFDKLESDYNQLVASDNMIKVAHETATRSILNAHAAMDKSGIIMTREKSKQGLTPRIKSIIARKLESDVRIAKLESMQKNAASDWADDHTYLVNLCLKAGIPADKVYGDKYGVPGIMELADLLASAIPNKPKA